MSSSCYPARSVTVGLGQQHRALDHALILPERGQGKPIFRAASTFSSPHCTLCSRVSCARSIGPASPSPELSSCILDWRGMAHGAAVLACCTNAPRQQRHQKGSGSRGPFCKNHSPSPADADGINACRAEALRATGRTVNELPSRTPSVPWWPWRRGENGRQH